LRFAPALALVLACPARFALPAAFPGDPPSEIEADRKPALATGGNCVIRNVTIHTAVSPPFRGDVRVEHGRIAEIGQVTAPPDVVVIDGAGGHLAPGVVPGQHEQHAREDANEGTVSISAEVSIADVIDADDLSIWRALAGGVTTARILHGSANTIGGQHEVLKMKWRKTADELRFPGAPPGIKFALGENPKRSNGAARTDRFPASRLGVEAVLLRAFSRADEYQREWSAYRDGLSRGEDPDPPRKDLRLEALAGVLSHTILVHSHCYRADEILMLLRASQRFGFKIATLQHVLEGYKVAKEMADLGVGGSTFGDWWAYKVEACAIPQNAALMDGAGSLRELGLGGDDAPPLQRRSPSATRAWIMRSIS
jgi:imidazolonepropionase-like amidohydrolase